MSSPDDDPDPEWIDLIQPDQVVAFRVFARPATELDRAIKNDPAALSALQPNLNPDLARRAYASPAGTIDLVPGPNAICCVVTVAGTGERISGSTSTELAAGGAHGFTSTGRDHSATFRGVLAANVSNLRIITGSGETVAVPVNDDDAYWITIIDPAQKILTLKDGTERQIPVARAGTPRRHLRKP